MLVLEAILILVLAIATADFVSGLIHWFADNYGSEEWPVIGPGLIEPFRNHHDNPNSMIGQEFWKTNFSTMAVAVLMLPFAFLMSGFAAKWWVASCVIGAFTNQFHKMAHETVNPWWWKALESSKLVLSRQRHSRHHRPPRRQAYCITSGWMNPVLERIYFFEVLEWAIFKLCKIKPLGHQ